uniref:Immediate early response 2 n=1 Tax=Sphenodon punctatus TaxID=8508 RepID=A0A8D0G4Y8_SPHPU
MEVQKEAQRIMTMSVWKLYHSRMQHGGLRLHRSLQLSLVMRSARELYLSAKLEEEEEEAAAAGEIFPGQLETGAQTPQPHLETGAQASERVPQPLPLPLERISVAPEPMETQEVGGSLPTRLPLSEPAWSPVPPHGGASKPSRKRRSSTLGKSGAAEAGLVPSKKAKLADEEESERQPQRQEGPFPTLAKVLQDRFSGLILQPPTVNASGEAKPGCRQGDGVLSIMVRAVVAF